MSMEKEHRAQLPYGGYMEKVRKRRRLCLWLMVVVCSDAFWETTKETPMALPWVWELILSHNSYKG